MSMSGVFRPTNLSRMEIEQFAQHPSAKAFQRWDPALEVSIQDKVPKTLPEALTRPSRGPSPGHALGHEMEHAEMVARAAEARPAAPLTRGDYYKFLEYQPTTQGPGLRELLPTMVREYPDLYGMYWIYRKAGEAPASAVGELMTEYFNRLKLKTLPGVRPQDLMTFHTPEVVIANYGTQAHKIFAELDEFMLGAKPALPKRHPNEATAPVPHDPAAVQHLWASLQAAREGRPLPRRPRINYSQFESRGLRRPR